jgi:hypothetical protein
MEKTGFIYIWYDRKRKMYYIGCHWGTVDDGYICSSNRMRDAYRRRPNDFKRRIIKKGIERESLLVEEHRWLQLILDEELGTKYYNLSKKHFGHWSNIEECNKTVRKKLSETSKKLHQDPVYKQKYMEGRKKLPPQTPEQIAKRSASNTGKKRTEETKRKISEGNKGKILGPLSEQHDPELKKQMNAKTSVTMKGRPPNNVKYIKGSFWWNNGVINKRSKECPGDGWFRGTVKNIGV